MYIHLRFSKHCWQYRILVTLHQKARNSRPEVFCEKDVFENFASQRRCPANFAKFSRTPLVAASEKLKGEAVVRTCSVKKVFLEILLNSQESTCARVFFTALRMQLRI